MSKAHQVHVWYKTEDGRSSVALSSMRELGAAGKRVKDVTIADTYTIERRLSRKQLEAVAEALHTPLAQKYAIDGPPKPGRFTFAIEVGYLPGVTDNVGATARETIQDVLKKRFRDDEHVYSSRLYFLSGTLDEADVATIAASLHNPLIERASWKRAADFKREKGMGVTLPKVTLKPGPVRTIDLYVSDEELIELGKKGIKDADGTHRGPLGLGLDELKAIRNHFHRVDRQPTDVELEAIAQTWSEHCKHTIFANPLDEITEGIYRRFIKRATREVRAQKGRKDFCVSVFSDNSGVIEFDKDHYITHKVETHNSPSALDPFGGAITGIGGVNRDTIGTGLGAKPLLNMYGYCFADPRDTTRLFRDAECTVELLSSRRILNGVVEGVNAGGNQSGIATPQGFTYFEPRYRGKPLVFVGTVGIMPKRVKGKPSYEKGARPGDHIVMVGGRVGLDGIHGATFSSEALDSGSPATAVQIGDPITQKKLSDAIIKEARDQGLYNSITDNGAGGLSSSVGEMAEECGGCDVALHKVPVKYPGLSPWQIWISESQERMTLAVPKKKWNAFQKLMKARGVEATVIGSFTDSGRCVVRYKKQDVVDVDMEFLHHGNPVHVQSSTRPERALTHPKQAELKKAEQDLRGTLLKLLAHPNIAGTEFISTQYDHEVQGVSVTKPLHGKGRVSANASVSRPITDTRRGVVLSQGLAPRYSDIDTYHMAASAIDQAIRNAVAIGADPSRIALLDNFCWCSSNEPERLYELRHAAEACYDHAVAYGTPFISGKDSMFNDFKGYDANGEPVKISVPPTLLISSIGIIDDVSNAVTCDLKQPGDLVYLLGETRAELGGSEYYALLGGYTGSVVPQVDAKKNSECYERYHKALQKGLIASAIPLDRGGLAAALLKSAIAGQLGMEIDISAIGDNRLVRSEKLFSESNGRLIVSVAPEDQKRFEQAMHKTACMLLGSVTDGNDIVLREEKKKIVTLKLDEATRAYRATFKNY